ncbi:MAG: DUF4837 family protein [Lutibacter sp.]|nr:DUF4837 family protein [Lutibacter sp.]MBP9600550.1 DUF4837 family protein [Lutibacter sp.]
MKKIIIVLFAVTLFISCGSGNDKKVLKEANGRINSLLIVIKNSEWQGTLGDELRKFLAEPIVGLPQPETQFEVSQVPIESFGSMFRATRNILSIGIGDENSFTISSNIYAEPQKIVTIIGKTEADLIELISKNSKKIIEEFKNSDLATVQRNILKKAWNPADIKTFKEQGFSIKIPRSYNKVDDTGDFAWFRYHIDGANSMELLVYTYPINSENDEKGTAIVTKRDSIGEKYIPGQVENSHMITEAAYTPHVFNVQLDGKPAFETRGKWEVKGQYMAGPFLSYSVVDKKKNRIVVVEGLTYAPSVNKRDYMFEIEAILKTLKID